MAVQQVLYTSATGFTERYAQMLGEAAALPVCRAGGLSPRGGGCLPGLALRRKGPGPEVGTVPV